MEHFLAELLDEPSPHIEHQKKIFGNEGTFSEKKFLLSVGNLNTTLLNSVFVSLSGGLVVPKEVVSYCRSRDPKWENEVRSFKNIVYDIFELSKMIYAVRNDGMSTAQLSYTRVLENRYDCLFMRRAFIERFATRILLSTGKPMPDALQDLRHALNACSQQTLMHAFKSVFEVANCTESRQKHAAISFYSYQRRSLEELRAARHAGTYEEAKNTDNKWPPFHLPVDALNDIVMRSLSSEERNGEQLTDPSPAPLTTVYEYYTRCITQDGYFYRRFCANRDTVWVSCASSCSHTDSDELSQRRSRLKTWITDIIVNKVAKKKSQTFMTHYFDLASIHCSKEHVRVLEIIGRSFESVLLTSMMHGGRCITIDPNPARFRLTVRSLSVDTSSSPSESRLGGTESNLERYILLPNCSSVKFDTMMNCKWYSDIVAQAVRVRLEEHELLQTAAMTNSNDHTHKRYLAMVQGRSLFYDFSLRYITKHCLIDFVWKSTTDTIHNTNHKYEHDEYKYDYGVVLIDNRTDNALGVASLLMALYNIAVENQQQRGDSHRDHHDHPSSRWGTFVFCGERNEAYTKRCLVPHFEDAERDLNVIAMPELSSSNEFSIEDYNSLLKSSTFWKHIRCKKCLIVQDDGMLVRPGVEREYMNRFDFVGAPWLQGQVILQNATNPHLVGNGGLSVRNVRAMIDIAEEGEQNLRNRELFVNGAQSVPEDVYFARGVWQRRDEYVLADRTSASLFSSEQELTDASLGFHKPWPYHRLTCVLSFFERILEETDTGGREEERMNTSREEEEAIGTRERREA